jgi:hypothetical protein
MESVRISQPKILLVDDDPLVREAKSNIGNGAL